MRRIESYLIRRISNRHVLGLILGQIAKAALISMLFSASLCSSALAAVSAGDRLPPDCCHFFSETNTDSLVTDFSAFRSASRARPSITRQPINCIRIKPSSRHWDFDYQLSNHRVGIAPASSVALAWGGFRWAASMLPSLLQSQRWLEFRLPYETQAEFAILKQALEIELSGLISANLRQPASPMPMRLIQRAIWEL